ncbi:ejaculatory bulb-specific protein 2 [Drosophila yakuba]|uniref:Uncharacterized protein n=1 Tax=Drosophila yakuba TaxID=7245 RepID=B4PC01_DROYA|nr:ejaculatory bulb-specific protein 2 [Drosophila yakuba]EDW92655.1 uncharacterized protein Dyak_GE11382 [Drosophila yakuba]
MIRILVLMITFALMTGSALCSIENLMRIFGGGSSGGGGSNRGSGSLDVNIVPPSSALSFGYGFRPGFF